MSQDGWLPPGVELSDIPGNRPEDVAWEIATEQVTSEAVAEACKARVNGCSKADWIECTLCEGNGYSPETGDDCNRCAGECVEFNGCSAGIVDSNGKVQDNADWSECLNWESLVRQCLKSW